MPLNPDQLAAAPFKPATGAANAQRGPTLYRGTFAADAAADTFL